MSKVRAYACNDTSSQFHPHTIELSDPGPKDVLFDVKYAGICHSDIHTARGEWGPQKYPLVPGHEIAGIVTAVGDQVTKFAIGDHIGVGCMTGSCLSDPDTSEDEVCEQCAAGHENFCVGSGTLWTYGDDRDGNPTAGGYSQTFMVDERFGLKIPDSIPLDTAAPLLCAGITTYSPLKRWGAGPGKKVAVVGMGGLGHMGVQLAAAMGADVSVISQTRAKEEDARRLGASSFYASSEEGTLRSLRNTFDIILCTVSASDFDYNSYFAALKAFGVFVNVGLPEDPATIDLNALISGDKVLAGSNIGGIPVTQEMLDFCAEHNIASVVEVIGGDDITQAYDNVVNSKVRYRYVIDTATF